MAGTPRRASWCLLRRRRAGSVATSYRCVFPIRPGKFPQPSQGGEARHGNSSIAARTASLPRAPPPTIDRRWHACQAGIPWLRLPDESRSRRDLHDSRAGYNIPRAAGSVATFCRRHAASGLRSSEGGNQCACSWSAGCNRAFGACATPACIGRISVRSRARSTNERAAGERKIRRNWAPLVYSCALGL